MAISPNRLAVKPTTTRGATQVSCVSFTDTIPPAQQLALVDGTLSLVDQDPEYEGQVLIYEGENSLIQMYVVVDIDGILTWKLVKITSSTIDWTTGRPFSSL